VTAVDRLHSVRSINVEIPFSMDPYFLCLFCKKTLRGVTAIAGQSASSPRRLSFVALTNFLRHSSVAKISVPTCTAIAFTRCTAPRPPCLHPHPLLRALQDNWQEREAAIAWSRCFPAFLPRLPNRKLPPWRPSLPMPQGLRRGWSAARLLALSLQFLTVCHVQYLLPDPSPRRSPTGAPSPSMTRNLGQLWRSRLRWKSSDRSAL
jgi:hypothetical protein